MEVELMVARNAFILDDMKDKAKAEGRQEGRIDERAELLIKQLRRKIGTLPEEYEIKIKGLDKDTLEAVAMDIFDLVTVEDLDKYLK